MDVLEAIDTARRRRRFVDQTYDHPRYAHCMRKLQRQFATCDIRKEKYLHILVGWTGSGKTRLLERFHEEHPDTETRLGVSKPIIYATLGNKVTEKAVVAAIFKQMGYELKGRFNKDDIIDEVALKVELLGTKMIIIDEAQNVMRGKAADNAEFLKSLRQRLPCDLVLAGLPQLEELKYAEGQLTRRTAPVSNLHAYRVERPWERKQFLEILRRAEAALELPAESGLTTPEIASRIYAASDGLMGIVIKLLGDALELTLEFGNDRIELEFLAQVFARDYEKSSADADTGGGVLTLLQAFSGADVEDDGLAELEDTWVPVDKLTNPFACPVDQLNRVHERQRDLFRSIEHNKHGWSDRFAGKAK